MAGADHANGGAPRLAPRERAEPPVQPVRPFNAQELSWARAPFLRRAGGRWVCLSLLLLGVILVSPALAEDEDPGAVLQQAAALENQGRLREAEAEYNRAADLAVERGDDDSEAEALFGCIRCAVRRYDMLALREANRRLRDVQIRMDDERGAAQTEADLGYIEADLGNCREALGYLDSALAYFQRIGSEEFVAHVMMRMGYAHFRACDYALALEYLEEAVRAHRSRDDEVSTAEALIFMGSVTMELGDPERALVHYEEALELFADEGPASEAVALGDIGIALIDMGRYEDALPYLDRADAAFEAAGDVLNARTSVLHRARLYTKTERYEEALALLESTAVNAEEDPVNAAYAQLYRGDALLCLGRTGEAQDVYDTLFETAEELGETSLLCRVHGAVAELRFQEGDAAGALEDAGRSLDLVRKMFLAFGPVNSALGRGYHDRAMDAGLHAAFSLEASEDAFDFMERCRAQTLLEGVGSRVALCGTSLPPELAALEAEARAALVAESTRYDAEVRGRRLDGIRSAAAAQSAAYLEYEAVLNRIQRHARRQSSPLFPTRVSLEDLQATLERSDALVFYCLPEGDAYALVVTRDRARRVVLGRTADIMEAAAALDVTAQDAQTVAGHVKSLKRLLVDPLKLPSRANRLLVSPDGRLSHVPFALLAGSRQVVFVPSGTVYAVSAGEHARRGEGVLALGDPDYQTEREGNAIRVYAGGVALRGLPRTRTEIQSITREGDVTRLGADAGEVAFREVVATRERWEAVHFACHGFVNARRPALSALALTPTETDDGFLTALEVYGMRIPADLIVLSACSTGKGRAVRGGGLVGLSEAFMYAGVPRVIASLWDVDDEATQSFMSAFYKHWRKGESTAGALRKAQLEVKRERRWRHPRYWAAWVLWGLPD